jgi:alditol oxidase
VALADRVRALGTGHSLGPIADTTGTQVSLAGLLPLIEIDSASRRVRVGGGVLARSSRSADLASSAR